MSASATPPTIPRVFRAVPHEDLVRTRLLLADIIAQAEHEIEIIETSDRTAKPQLIAARLRQRLDRIRESARRSGICTPSDLSLARRSLVLHGGM